MSTAPVLWLSKERAGHLQNYIYKWRQYALTTCSPSTERNTNQRVLQGLEGKIIQASDQLSAPNEHMRLFLEAHEVKSMKTMLADLLLFVAQEPQSEKRAAMLLDLAALKSALGRMYDQQVREIS
jgi:hypothetical protein